MTSASVAGGLAMRSRFEPALRRRRPVLAQSRMPVAGIVISIFGHTLFVLALAAVIIWNNAHRSRVYVVNLVPLVAAVGSPTAPPAPSLPARPVPPLPARAPDPTAERPREMPTREPAKPPEPLRPQPREMPTREPAKLPEPSRPQPRAASLPALPRPGDKELPPLSGSTLPQRAERPVESRPAPTAALGRPTGSVSGTGALTLDVSDFPYAWYLRQVLQKVQGEWQRQNRPSEPDQKPLVFVEIQRDGSIKMPKIEQSSGNSLYDQAALRAVVQASPFPPLPQEWSKPALRVMFRFELQRERG